jgi:hypothetical protein
VDANGRVYVGSLNGKLYALDTIATAPYVHEAWNFTAGNAIWSSPALANGFVAFGADDRSVYVLNASDGALRWTARTAGDVRAPLAIEGSTLYVASGDGVLHAFGGALPPLADLAVGNVTLPDPLRAGPVSVQVEVRNVGTLAAPATTLTLWADGNLSALASQAVPPIPAGANATVMLPWNASVGNHTLDVLADAFHAARQANRANDHANATALVLPPPKPPAPNPIPIYLQQPANATNVTNASNASAPPKKGGGFLGVPGPELPLAALGVALAAWARRRA